MGLSTISLGKCETQARNKERKFIWVEGDELDIHIFAWRAIFACKFWDKKGEQSVVTWRKK
jgi:hypothetical protein